MKTEDLLRQQLVRRLKRLHERASALRAEIGLVERLLADAEQGAFQPNFKLRKNSVRKLNAQAHVRKCLKDAGVAVQARFLYASLLRTDPSLKPSTFRSHLRRMVEMGIIRQQGSRGNYVLADKGDEVKASLITDETHKDLQ